jgi:hypothetical protein
VAPLVLSGEDAALLRDNTGQRDSTSQSTSEFEGEFLECKQCMGKAASAHPSPSL